MSDAVRLDGSLSALRRAFLGVGVTPASLGL